MAHMYDVGTKAWQPDQTEGWVASEVTEKRVDGEKVRLVFVLESGEVRAVLAEREVLDEDGHADGRRPRQSRRRSPRSRRRTRIRPPSHL